MFRFLGAKFGSCLTELKGWNPEPLALSLSSRAFRFKVLGFYTCIHPRN